MSKYLPYITAIRRLMDIAEASDYYGGGDVIARDLLAVLRGPDSDDDAVKLVYTAPLRTYLLGEQACVSAGYGPRASASLPGRTAPLVAGCLHYSSHISRAVSIIETLRIPTAPEYKMEVSHA